MAFVPAGGERDVDFMYDDDLDLGGREDERFDISSSERTSFDRVAVVEEKIWSAKITSGNKKPAGQCYNRQPTIIQDQLRMAVINGKIETVKEFINSGYDPDIPLKGGWTALMYACNHGNHDIIQFLLDKGANTNSHKDMFSCLMALCCSKRFDEEILVNSANLLINKGARVNSHDRHHMTPLLYACQTGHTGLAGALISSNADVNKQDARGWSPLCYAVLHGDLSLVELLLSNGANPEISTHVGDTPATLALSRDSRSIIDAIDTALSSRGKNYTDLAQSRNNLSVRETKIVPDGSSIQYGDLELFLAGLQLGHLAQLFQTHQVKFSTLLSMTDKDLEDIGVSQVGLRKKITNGVTELHKTQWKMPDDPLPFKRALSLQEYSLVLSQLANHIRYLHGSTSFIIGHTSSKAPSPITMASEPREVEELTNQIQAVVIASQHLKQEVSLLEQLVYDGLGRKPPAKSEPVSKKKLVIETLKWSFIMSSAILLFIYCYPGNRPISFPKRLV